MPGVTLDNSRNALQIMYAKRFQALTTDKVEVWAKCPTYPDAVGGDYLETYIQTGYGVAGGGKSHRGTVSKASYVPTFKTKIFFKNIVLSLGVDWVAKWRSATSSYVSLLRQAIDRNTVGGRVLLERMICGDGSGKLTGIYNPLNSAGGSLTTTPTTLWTFDTYLNEDWMAARLTEGARFQVVSGTLGVPTETSSFRLTPTDGYYSVYSVAYDNPSAGYARITVNEAPPLGHGIAAADCAVAEGSWDQDGISSGYHSGTEMMGYMAICDDGYPPLRDSYDGTYPASATFQGVDPAARTLWQAIVYAAGGAEADQPLFDKVGAIMTQRGSVGPEELNFWLANPIQEAIITRNMYGGVRYPVTNTNPALPVGAANTMTTKNLMVAGRELLTTRFISTSVILGIGPGTYKFPVKPWGFHVPGEGGGPVWHRDYDRRMQDQAEITCCSQIGTLNRRSNLRIEGLASTM